MPFFGYFFIRVFLDGLWPQTSLFCKDGSRKKGVKVVFIFPPKGAKKEGRKGAEIFACALGEEGREGEGSRYFHAEMSTLT